MKKLRPKGCGMTISGRHMPMSEIQGNYSLKVFCEACRKIDDTGELASYLFGKPKKIDDSNL